MAQPTGYPLDPTATISRAFKVYRDYAGVLLPLSFGLFAIQAILELVFQGDTSALAISGLVGGILGTVFQGAVVELARDVEDGTLDSSPGQLLSAVTPVIVPLFIVGFLANVGIAIGLILIIVPGLFLATFWAVVGPVTVLERPGIFAAFGRSRQLVRGSGGPVFGLVLFNIVLVFGAGIVAGIVGAAGGDAVSTILTWIAVSLVSPATALIAATAYLRLRELHGDPTISTGAASPDGPKIV